MNIVLWVIAALLAAAFLMAGAMKVIQPRERLVASGMAWAGDFPPAVVKAIGVLEVLGAAGLILPAVTGVAPIVVPLAATGLVLMMAGAVIVHVRRGEFSMMAPSVVLLILAAVVAWGRFGPYAF
ncbi:DoxX family protein [Catenuloplanes indicus]|uniref:Membrane protein n=1 Tax=Catenuloplanes indicus TaxID=137267 RepID=A0AAE3WA35_9ACTN|nr:DoxX family protein [Catenuloplanes indicus]MDQ0371384.1 putative membrane protein [Catenuloplanes indicus]